MGGLKKALAALPFDQERTLFVLGLSGGVDSTVLLAQLLAQKAPALFLKVVHIDHGLQAASVQFRRHCQHICAQYRQDLTIIPVHAKPQPRQSPEQAARAARYQALVHFAKGQQAHHAQVVIAVAHHQDDQAETLLLQLVRGSGARGLAGMPILRQLDEHIYLWRPLLNCPRAQIEAYAKQHQLDYIEDPSNTDCQYLRNFVRRQIMPQLAARLPQVGANLARSCQLLGEQNQLIEDIGSHYCAAYLGKAQLPCAVFGDNDALNKTILRSWLLSLNAPLPSYALLAELLKISRAPSGMQRWGQCELRCYQQVLYFYRADFWQALYQIPRQFHQNVALNHIGQILPIGIYGQVDAAFLNATAVDIGFIDGAQFVMQSRFYPANKSHSISLKNHLQQQKVPPWLRGFCALLLVDARISAVLIPQNPRD